jgi:hypothetical protein
MYSKETVHFFTKSEKGKQPVWTSAMPICDPVFQWRRRSTTLRPRHAERIQSAGPAARVGVAGSTTSIQREESVKKQLILSGFALAASVSAGLAFMAPDLQDPPQGMEGMPEFAAPGEQHEWLHQLVGEWTVESEMSAPGMPEPMKSTGTDSVRSLGGRWIIAELDAEIPDMGKMTAILQLGYDSETGKYQGTWIDSHTDYLWVYEGTLDPTKKILTLEVEGPDMMNPGQTTMYRDVITIVSADERTLTSSAQVDGEWVQFVKATYRRK